MQYYHRSPISPDEAIAQAAAYFGARMSPTEELPRRLRLASALGELSVNVLAEGGHYTRVRVATNQPGESELDKVAKRFLTLLHTSVDPTHRPIGAY
jgi:hypothetical protein